MAESRKRSYAQATNEDENAMPVNSSDGLSMDRTEETLSRAKVLRRDSDISVSARRDSDHSVSPHAEQTLPDRVIEASAGARVRSQSKQPNHCTHASNRNMKRTVLNWNLNAETHTPIGIAPLPTTKRKTKVFAPVSLKKSGFSWIVARNFLCWPEAASSGSPHNLDSQVGLRLWATTDTCIADTETTCVELQIEMKKSSTIA
jgi:hypothetical protein